MACCFIASLLCGSSSAQTTADASKTPWPATWTASWGSAQALADRADWAPPRDLAGTTLRQVVHLSIGGSRLRLRFSNAFGDGPLILDAVHIARAQTDGGSIDPATQAEVLFNGSSRVVIPAGAEYLSDEIQAPWAALSDMAVSFYVEATPKTITSHPGARATSFLSAGNHAVAGTLPAAATFSHWYFLSEVDTYSASSKGTLIALGDSITDGRGSTDNANGRWTDVLAKRLAPLGTGVTNKGIGGNRLLDDGLGPSALARFDRDVTSVAGARYLLLCEGINDIGTLDRESQHPQADHDRLVRAMEAALEQMALRAHLHGLRIFAATLTPFLGSDYYHPGPVSESDRQQINTWIRRTRDFDGVVDFDALLQDPQRPGYLLPAFDSGDHLHPGPEGYRRMGGAVSLALFTTERTEPAGSSAAGKHKHAHKQTSEK